MCTLVAVAEQMRTRQANFFFSVASSAYTYSHSHMDGRPIIIVLRLCVRSRVEVEEEKEAAAESKRKNARPWAGEKGTASPSWRLASRFRPPTPSCYHHCHHQPGRATDSRLCPQVFPPPFFACPTLALGISQCVCSPSFWSSVAGVAPWWRRW